MNWFRLAFKYIAFYKVKTAILIACVFLTAFLPIAIELFLNEFESKIVSRAAETPLVVGPTGSRFDLTLRSLYFRIGNSEEKGVETIEYGEAADIVNSGWASAIPVYSKFTSNDFPVVGTSLDYFEFRGLQIASGDNLVQIGDCVVGAELAKKLGIATGDKLLTDIESVISIASYPLKMHVRGVFAKNNSPDDWAIFVDLKTAWIIDGIGHGHQDLETEDDDKLLSKSEDKIVASAAVLPYTEITDANIDSFHFHGDTSGFPVSAVIAIPFDEKSKTILIGRYRNKSTNQQLVVPANVIEDLMNLVFKVKRFFDANAVLIAISTILLLILIVVLSLKLRDQEMNTMFKIGASRNTVAMLQIAELGIVFLISAVLVVGAIFLLNQFSGEIVQSMLVGT